MLFATTTMKVKGVYEGGGEEKGIHTDDEMIDGKGLFG